MNAEARTWKCGSCSTALVPKEILLAYMGHSVAQEVPTCPKCGRVYISEELAGRMSEFEQALEDK